MDHCKCGPGARCAPGPMRCSTSQAMHVLDVRHGQRRLVVTVETDAEVSGCRRCGVLAVGHGRRRLVAADAPCFGRSVAIVWLKRVWRCPEFACPSGTWSEEHELIPPPAVLTSRAVGWATDALARDDTTVSAPAHHLRVDWHTLCGACGPRRWPARVDRTGSPACGRWAWTSTSGDRAGRRRATGR